MKRIPLGCDADEGRGGRHGDSLLRNCKIWGADLGRQKETFGIRRLTSDISQSKAFRFLSLPYFITKVSGNRKSALLYAII